MKNAIKYAFATVAIACSCSATARSISEFLSSYQVVREGGMSAMFGAEAQSLMNEANDALRTWKGQQATAKPKVCAPPGSEDMDPAEFVQLLNLVPAKDRPTTSVKTGVITTLNRRYPC